MKVCERLRFLVLGIILFGVCVVSLPAAEEVAAGGGSQVAIGVEAKDAADAMTEEQIAERVSKQVLAEFQKVVEQQTMAVKGHDDELKIKLLEEQVAAYKETVEYQKDSLGKILTVLGVLTTVILAAVGFVVLRFSHDYREAVKVAKDEVRQAVSQMKEESKGAVAQAQEVGKEAKSEVKQAVKEMKTESKEAVAEVRGAVKEARTACEKAAEWEGKTQEVFERVDLEVKGKLAKIDKVVEGKMKEIDKMADKRIKGIDKLVVDKMKEIEVKAKTEADESVKQITEKAEKERDLSKLWNDAIQTYNRKEYEKASDLWKQLTQGRPDDYVAFNNWGSTLGDWAKLLEGEAKENKNVEACEKFAKAVEIKPDYYMAVNNLGYVIVELAKLLKGEAATSKYSEACDKFAAAVKIKPDKYKAFEAWGAALLFWAAIVDEPEKTERLDKAIEKCMKAEGIKKGEGAYNLACAYAIKGDEGNCKKWLGVGEEAGTLVSWEHASKDEDLKAYWDEDWFKEIRWGK